MKKYISLTILLLSMLLSAEQTYAALSASQVLSATLSRPGGGGGGGGGGTGGIVAGGVVGGGAAGASSIAFAPLLLAGLSPNSVVCAAAPLNCFSCIQNFLQAAIIDHFNVSDYALALERMKNTCKTYFAQDNSTIINGTFDMHALTLPKELLSAQRVKVNITMASQSYKVADGTPELALGLYKDITLPNLIRKFQTQQFLHHYLMKKYETPLTIVSSDFKNGVQKLSGILDMSKIQNKNIPLEIAVRYTEGGFKINMRKQNPKVITYAYLVEFEKIR